MSHETENQGQEATETAYPITLDGQYGIAITDAFEAENKFITVGGLKPLVDAVRDVVANTILQNDDDRVALAKKVHKTALEAEKFGKALAAEYKARPKIIDGNRKHVADSLEALEAAIMQPITERKARRARLDAIAQLPSVRSMATIAEIDDELQRLYDINPAEFVELEQEFVKTRESVQAALLSIKANREQEEKDRAELERLRAEQAKRDEEARLEAARAEGERQARERMAAEKEAAERDAVAAAQATAQTARVVTREIASETQKAVSDYDAAYSDIKAVIASNGFGDLAANILSAIAAGKIRNVTTTIGSV